MPELVSAWILMCNERQDAGLLKYLEVRLAAELKRVCL